MRSLSMTVILLLLLRIAYGSIEKGEELCPSGTPPIPDCHLQPGECTQKDGYLRKVCIDLCRSGTDCDSGMLETLNITPDGSYISESPRKRGPLSKNSFLLMKLHPVLNRAVVDSNIMNVPTRYRRIGVRLGSEFLGKRSVDDDEEEEEEEDVVRRGRRLPGTELLGKRHGSEMLGKRNVEMLGKRGGEFLGKRGAEFLGKRGNEFLGKRGNEFLGKRSHEFLGKRGNEFLGKRMWMCRDGGDCLPLDAAKILLQYFKVAEGKEAGNPEEGCGGRSNPPDRRQLNPLHFLEKL